MRTRNLVRRGRGLLLGAMLAGLFACAGQPPSPPVPAPDPTPALQSPPSAAAGSAGVAPEAVEEEITVTGNRIRRDDFTDPRYGEVLVSAQSAAIPPGVDAGLPAPAIGGARARAAATESPLSRVQPGEELWIISRPRPPAGDAAAADADHPGSGALVANVAHVTPDANVANVTPDANVAHVTPDAHVTPADAAFVNEPQTVPLPLEHTAVQAVVTGYVGTVDVTQQFTNPFDEKIEAVYLFPLPEKAAVSEFVMTIGERQIRGILRERKEAEEIYAQARAQGYQASLLTQHRPNIFEQKVANIEPGKRIDVNIRYFHTLAYRDGWYSFVFPTVVGPRYNPPGSSDPVLALPRADYQPTSGAAVRYLRPNERSAHDLSITVELHPGVAIEEIESTHPLRETEIGPDAVRVELADVAMLPNEDFVLDFRVEGEQIKSNLLTYRDPQSDEGYFTLMLYPPSALEALERQPLELVFVLDGSGSMNGRPIEQAKAAVLAALDRLEPDDTFQIIRFSTDASSFGPDPVPATRDNIRRAKRYVEQLAGSGGTQMIEGIKAALDFPHDPRRLRFVTFLTDGYIGNEAEILREIDARLGTSRIFSFGVGNSVNRYLIERMASTGRGAVAYVALEDSGGEIMDYFFDRISHPALIDVEIDWGRMRVSDVYPARLPDLFVGRPVVVTGRYAGEAAAPTVSGRAGGEPLAFRLAYSPAEAVPGLQPDFLPSLWARLRIADLADRRIRAGDPTSELAGAIKQTALKYRLMSDYTAFIAVDASRVTDGDHGTTVYQAVPVPRGVRYETTVAP